MCAMTRGRLVVNMHRASAIQLRCHKFNVGHYVVPELEGRDLDGSFTSISASGTASESGARALRWDTIFGEDSVNDTHGLMLLALGTVVGPCGILLYLGTVSIAALLPETTGVLDLLRSVVLVFAHVIGILLALANGAYWVFLVRGTLVSVVTEEELIWWRRLGPIHWTSRWALRDFSGVEVRESSDSEFRVRRSRVQIYLQLREPTWYLRRRIVLSCESSNGAAERARWLALNLSH